MKSKITKNIGEPLFFNRIDRLRKAVMVARNINNDISALQNRLFGHSPPVADQDTVGHSPPVADQDTGREGDMSVVGSLGQLLTELEGYLSATICCVSEMMRETAGALPADPTAGSVPGPADPYWVHG